MAGQERLHLALHCCEDAVSDCWTRLQGGYNVEEASLHVAVPEVLEGSLMQLHVRDAEWSQKGVKACLQVCVSCDFHFCQQIAGGKVQC